MADGFGGTGSPAAIDPRAVELRHRTKPGGGTVTDALDRTQFREPGNASSEEAAVLDRKVFVDPGTPGTVRFHLENVTIDDSAVATINIGFGDGYASPTEDTPDNEGLTATIIGGGLSAGPVATTTSGGTASSSSDRTENNAWVQALDWIELSWDGSALTVRATDGTTELSATESGNYPTATLPVHRISALDSQTASGNNIDFDVTWIEIR